MPAAPFHPDMGRARRPVHGAWHAVGLAAALVCAMWAGVHGLGRVVGQLLALAALVVIFVALIVGGASFAGWAVREIRAEIERERERAS